MTYVVRAMTVLVAGTLAANTWASDGHVARPRCDVLCRFLENDSIAQQPAALPADHPASPVTTPAHHLIMPRIPRGRVVVASRRFDAETAASLANGVEELGNPPPVAHDDLLRSVGPPTVARFALMAVAAQNSVPAAAGLLVTAPVLPPAAVPPDALAPAVRQVATVVLAKNTVPVETIEGSSAAVVDTPLVPSRGNEAEPPPAAATVPLPANDQAFVEPPPFDVIAALLLAAPPPRQRASVATAY